MAETIEDRSFNDETVVLDDRIFVHCTFTGCRLEFHGGELPRIHECESNECEWSFEGAAERTIQFMALLFKSGEGGRRLVEYTYEHIMRGSYTED